ncbi:hypothetical protein KW842_21755 [Duganella sp. sic0402]|uniref:hypothetical protein n=1 Tax=Duganella sp. sic0402 TaxID=2854786 RepID=UPI001C47BC08|nr:hypothetical protein [Duganella sp. sic0402]MBV7538404.1 hypothetical protein [Duganella sp. sic0402]
MKTFTKAIAIILFSLPLIASAAGKIATASMQVSFEVKESCNVQGPATAADAVAAANTATKAVPAVACQLKTPYQMTRSTEQAAAVTSREAQATALRQETSAGAWTITF